MAIDRRKRILFSIVFGLLLYALLELSLFGALVAMERLGGADYRSDSVRLELSARNRAAIARLVAGEASTVIHSPSLGWTKRPNTRAPRQTLNSHGIRSKREYSLRPPSKRLRIAAFGDSFTFGAEVEDDDAWAAQLDALRPELEVLNFGVGSYGLDQAYLRYRQDGVRFEPDVIFIGYMAENALRSVNVFRPFYVPGGLPLSKPRFVLSRDELTLLGNPLSELADYQHLLDDEESTLRELGVHDYYFQRNYYDALSYNHLPSVRVVRRLSDLFFEHSGDLIRFGVINPESEAFTVTAKIFEDFYAEALANGAFPIVLMFPSKSDLARQRNGKPPRYGPFLELMEREGLRYVDLLQAFAEPAAGYSVDELCASHYTPLGNKLVAEHLADQMATLNRQPARFRK